MEILSAEPLVASSPGRPKGATAAIRERHHALAKLVAAGVSYAQAGRMVGMTGPGVEAWAKNPANAELIAQYTAEGLVAQVDSFLEARAAVMAETSYLARLKIRDQLRDALEDDAPIPLDKLVRVAADCDDRTGLGRVETRHNINEGQGAALDAARKRIEGLEAARASGKVVEFVRRA